MRERKHALTWLYHHFRSYQGHHLVRIERRKYRVMFGAQAGPRESSRKNNVKSKKDKTMNTIRKMWGMAAVLCIGAANVFGAGHTYNLTAITSGNWNSAGHRTSSNYQIGYSSELPNEQAAYFEFDLTPAKGKHITSANMLIPGSTDYSIQSWWGSPHNFLAFKVRVLSPNAILPIRSA